MLKCVITGGPGGGKTEIMSYLTQQLNERGYKVFIVPESATELIINGIIPGSNISLNDFQTFVLKKQLSKESIYDLVTEFFDKSKVVIFYDRGLLDACAYVDKETIFKGLLANEHMSFVDAYNRYDAVVHLVTAANGAEKFYQWNDPTKESVGNNAARRESPSEAIEKDNKTLNAWVGHPHLRVFDNSTDFIGKVQRVMVEIFSLLGEPIPKEIERKFLIKKPSEKEISELGCISKTNIVQTYLKSEDTNIERRIRQRGDENDGYSFYYTEKTPISSGERIEKESIITPKKYIELLVEADSSLHQILKTRYCFMYKNQYFELDLYPFDENYAILEIELNNINDHVEFPPLKIIKDVTNDSSFKNSSLAKSFNFTELANKVEIEETPWIYETGEEVGDILGSGSSYYNIIRTKDEEKALLASKELSRTYLIREKKVNGKTIHEYYDGHEKKWL